MELPENLSQDVRVDVAFSMDSSKILNVKVILKDGSGKELNACIDRDFGEKRIQLEKKLDEIKSKVDQKKLEIDTDAQKNIDGIYNEAINALTVNNMDEAEKKIREMEKEIEKMETGGIPDWKNRAEGLIGYADIVLQKYDCHLEASQSFKIKKLRDELQNTLEKNDKQFGEKKYADLDKELDEIPELVRIFMRTIIVISIAINKGDVVNADKLRNLLGEIENAAKNNIFNDTVKRNLDELINIIKKVTGDEPPPPKSGEGLLIK